MKLLLLLILIISAFTLKTTLKPTKPTPKNIIDGEWINQHKSKAYLRTIGNQLVGAFESKVGNATGMYHLEGRIIYTDTGALMGWTVAWNNTHGNSNSVTTWSAYYCNVAKKIFSTWVLTSRFEHGRMWKAQHIGSDTFESYE